MVNVWGEFGRGVVFLNSDDFSRISRFCCLCAWGDLPVDYNIRATFCLYGEL